MLFRTVSKDEDALAPGRQRGPKATFPSGRWWRLWKCSGWVIIPRGRPSARRQQKTNAFCEGCPVPGIRSSTFSFPQVGHDLHPLHPGTSSGFSSFAQRLVLSNASPRFGEGDEYSPHSHTPGSQSLHLSNTSQGSFLERKRCPKTPGSGCTRICATRRALRQPGGGGCLAGCGGSERLSAAPADPRSSRYQECETRRFRLPAPQRGERERVGAATAGSCLFTQP